MKLQYKIILVLLLYFIVGDLYLSGQSYDKNFVKSSDVLTEGILTTGQVNQLSGNQIRNTINYYDGLGKPVQSVIVKKSPGSKDIVSITEYDEFGRIIFNYLPFTEGNNSGKFIVSARDKLMSFYSSPPTGVAATNIPYGETRYDDSPLNRVMETTLPGEGYEMGAGHTKQTDYDVNTENEVILFEVNQSGNIVKGGNGFYPKNQLHVVTTTDENDISTKVFTDKQGRQVLKRTLTNEGNFDTYYVYNKRGLLACVIMPGADVSQSVFNDFDNAFKYVYDKRKRQIEKDIPAKGPVYYVYDKLDRLAAEQDAVMRNCENPYWKFYKYDKLGRLIVEGRYFSTMNRSELQNQYDNLDPTLLYEEKASPGNPEYLGYTNNVFPTSSIFVNRTTFYDDYDFNNEGRSLFDDYFQQPFSDSALAVAKGQVTGKKYKDDDLNFVTTEVYFYDTRYRIVQSNKFLDNQQKEAFCTGNRYSFGGAVLKTNYKFRSQDADTLKYAFRFFYDNDWRNTGYALITADDSIPLVGQEYSETGNLIAKTFDPRNNNPLYTMDYRYNPRGWLTSINQISTNFDDMIFGLQLFYENPPQVEGIPSEPQYNGNISAMKWFTKDEEITPYINAYEFLYDDLSRLKTANFYKTNSYGTITTYPVSGAIVGDNSGYPWGIGSVDSITYDKNGNINSLIRAFRRGSESTLFDKLTYYYEANRLIAVDDDIPGQNNMGDFTDNGHIFSSSRVLEYHYDDNGNMTEDINRGIKVDYLKELNLPKTITFEDGYIENRYFYNGTKYRKQEFDPEGNLLNDETYFGNLVLRNDRPFRILYDDGYVNLPANGLVGELNFHVKDHLGNVRCVLSETPDRQPIIEQASGYFPFGMLFQSEQMQTSASANANKYLYNGKEVQNMPGKWYDYGARFYDAGLCRFHTLDPLSEKYGFQSPFVYGANNPIRFIDKNGKGPGDIIASLAVLSVKVKKWIGGLVNYAQQTTTTSGTYKSMNIIEANQKGLSTQKAVIDANQIISPAVDAMDVRIGAGLEIADKRGNKLADANIEIGTDGGIIEAEAIGSSAELSVDENGNPSGNISFLGLSVVGNKPKDENKVSLSTPTKPIYGKVLLDKKEAKENYSKAKESIESIKKSFSLFNREYDDKNK